MRRPIIDWDDNDFLTEINGMTFRIIARKGLSYYKANAYIPSYTSEDKWCNEALSEKSTEDAILKLVKLLEQ